MKILYIDRKSDYYFYGFLNHLDRKRNEIFLLDLKNYEYSNLNTGEVVRLLQTPLVHRVWMFSYLLRYYVALCFIWRFRNAKWDVCHVLGLKEENFWLLPFFRKRVRKLIITIYGRDIYLNKAKNKLFKSFYKYSDVITYQNQTIKEEFIRFNQALEVLYFEEMPMPIDHFRKTCFASSTLVKNEAAELLGLRKDLLRISCSSMINSNDQHFKVIEALKKLNQPLKIQPIFLLTYGGTESELLEIVSRIETELACYDYRIFTKTLSSDEILKFRLASDIYINMRKTDQIAGAILESLAAGTLLLSAAWLNYSILDRLNIYYKKVNDFNHLAFLIAEAIESIVDFNLTHGARNSRVVLENFAVENVILKWEKLYLNETIKSLF